ncbi:MAG: hypothetical protein O2852_03265 [Bacteroidetes bacterium]|nr:hypothetical protein [Bacteroidota bacterium]MDA0980358.1 hypothetical protein [Bacteroidota bacterium]
MKLFVRHIFLFLSIVALLHLGLAFIADVTTDDYYLKFSSPKQSSLILGTSRAKQGIIPSVLSSSIENSNLSIFNFSFTLKSSPFGLVYYNAIKQKIDLESKDGCFIVTVDPWSLSKKISDVNKTPDSLSVLFGISDFTSQPNFKYLFKQFPHGWGRILLNRIEKPILKYYSSQLDSSLTGAFSMLDNDGWLDVYTPLDSAFVKRKEAEIFELYRNKSNYQTGSESRIDYLDTIVEFLSNHGEVYVVRLPVHKKMLSIEQQYMPDFNSKISNALLKSKGYLDFSTLDNEYSYTDGNHLTKTSAKEVTQHIGEWISGLADE